MKLAISCTKMYNTSISKKTEFKFSLVYLLLM